LRWRFVVGALYGGTVFTALMRWTTAYTLDDNTLYELTIRGTAIQSYQNVTFNYEQHLIQRVSNT